MVEAASHGADRVLGGEAQMSQPEHADLHPGNVIMTAGAPRLLDWTGAVRAPVAFDLAFGHIVLIELARPDHSAITIAAGTRCWAAAAIIARRNVSVNGSGMTSKPQMVSLAQAAM